MTSILTGPIIWLRLTGIDPNTDILGFTAKDQSYNSLIEGYLRRFLLGLEFILFVVPQVCFDQDSIQIEQCSSKSHFFSDILHVFSS